MLQAAARRLREAPGGSRRFQKVPGSTRGASGHARKLEAAPRRQSKKNIENPVSNKNNPLVFSNEELMIPKERYLLLQNMLFPRIIFEIQRAKKRNNNIDTMKTPKPDNIHGPNNNRKNTQKQTKSYSNYGLSMAGPDCTVLRV